MKNLLLTSTISLLSFGAVAQDLSLPTTERWLAQFGGFTCGESKTPVTNTPAVFKEKNIMFTYMTTDYSLDNGKFVASFYENGVECRYNLIALADNANFKLTKVDSTAYAINGGSTCAEGKAYLDSLLTANDYAYLHGSIAVKVSVADAAAVCGEGESTVGLFFKKALKPKIEQ